MMRVPQRKMNEEQTAEAASHSVHVHAVEVAEHMPQKVADEEHPGDHKDCSDIDDMAAVERSVEILVDHEQMAEELAACGAGEMTGQSEQAGVPDSDVVCSNHLG